MRTIRKPTFTFETASDTGIDQISEGSLVLVRSSDEIFHMKDNSGLDSNSTIQDAIDNNKLMLSGGDTSTGLEKVTENSNDGWRDN